MYAVVQFIDDFEELKRACYKHLHEYIENEGGKNVDIDQEITKEYENQKKYLENSVSTLKKRLEEETKAHKQVNFPF